MRRRRPEERANARQREAVRAHLHAIVDRAVDGWAGAERQWREMGRGFPSRSGGGAGSGVADPVGEMATSSEPDPSQEAASWLEAFRAWRAAALHLDAALRRLGPPPPERLAGVERCAECGSPATSVKRLDGAPYHPEGCWWRAYNRTRRRREA